MRSEMVQIPKHRLIELEAKERAHDDYLTGLKALKQRAAAIDLEARGLREPDITALVDTSEIGAYALGYRQALNDIAVAIVIASQARHEGELVNASMPDGSASW